MDAKTFYRIIFVGNKPYKDRRKELNNRMKRQVYAGIKKDDYWDSFMLNDLYKSMQYYVRKFILGVFKILIFKIS